MIDRVLVVDDEPLVRSFVTAVLDGEVGEIREAENGQAALEILADWEPNVIVLDVAMPVMDGMAFLDTWSRSPSWRRIPVVVASGNVPRGPMWNALVELGVSEIVKKPFTMGTLLEAVRRAAGQTAGG
jgi:CheY-like chemotaxis protein